MAGRDRALLIDTGTGTADLAACARSLTGLPLAVVNTHGHPDHAGGNFQFDTVYAHPSDFGLIARFTGAEARKASLRHALGQPAGLESFVLRDTAGFDTGRLAPARAGHVFDLGGRTLEVIETPGHTAGSICLLDAEHRLLFTGDNDNTLVWLFLDHCLPLETYLGTLRGLRLRAREFETILPGHGAPLDGDFIGDQIACAERILDGTCKGEPYQSFAGEALLCTHGRAGIAFNPLNLRAKP